MWGKWRASDDDGVMKNENPVLVGSPTMGYSVDVRAQLSCVLLGSMGVINRVKYE